MGRSKKNVAPEPKEKKKLLVCYFCDVEFEEDHLLVQHQRTRHFRCSECRTAGGAHAGICHTMENLISHTRKIHCKDLKKVPNAKEGRDNPKRGLWIHGMQNVPEEFLTERNLPTWLAEWRPKGLEGETLAESLESGVQPKTAPQATTVSSSGLPLPSSEMPVATGYFGNMLQAAAATKEVPATSLGAAGSTPPAGGSGDFADQVKAWMATRAPDPEPEPDPPPPLDLGFAPPPPVPNEPIRLDLTSLQSQKPPEGSQWTMNLEEAPAPLQQPAPSASAQPPLETKHRDRSRSRRRSSSSSGSRRRSRKRSRSPRRSNSRRRDRSSSRRQSDRKTSDYEKRQPTSDRKPDQNWKQDGWSNKAAWSSSAGRSDDRWKSDERGRQGTGGSAPSRNTGGDYEKRTLSISMGSVPSRIWLKNLLAGYGRVEVCHTGDRNNPEKEPPWIRFVLTSSAESAKRAIDAGLVCDEVGFPVKAEFKKGGKFYAQATLAERPEINSRDLLKNKRQFW